MQTEYEAKFLNIDIDSFRDVLKNSGATCVQPIRLMQRAIIENPHMQKKDGFIRIRDEGDKVTVTYKQFDALSVDGALEHTIEVSSFDETVHIFAAAGMPHKSLQESKRETWMLDEAEIVIDEWPWLHPYIEIESNSALHVQQIAEMLGFHWSDAVFGDVMVAYRAQYPHLRDTQSISELASVRFVDPLPKLLTENA